MPAASCDYRGTSGMCVILGQSAAAIDFAALERSFLAAKRDAERRFGLELNELSGPVVRVIALPEFRRVHHISPRLDGDVSGDHGWTAFASGEITITGPAVMRHEAFHYILWQTGYPDDRNAAHDHPIFDEFRDGAWLPRRTVAGGASVPGH